MLQTAESAIVQTLVVGGTNGTPFNDINSLGWAGEVPLNIDHPIAAIEVRHDNVVDGLNITYQRKDGTTREFKHGAQKGGISTLIRLNNDEIVIDVIGNAGYHPVDKRSLIFRILFVILNRQTSQIRVEGPFGDNNTVPGIPGSTGFQHSGTIAFAGFETASDGQAGLAGLSFFSSIAWA